VKAYIKRNKHDAADAEAICEAVVHWVTEKPRALVEISRVLKPGGRVATTLTNESRLFI